MDGLTWPPRSRRIGTRRYRVANPVSTICATKASSPTRLWPGDAAAINLYILTQCTSDLPPMLTKNSDPEHSVRMKTNHATARNDAQPLRRCFENDVIASLAVLRLWFLEISSRFFRFESLCLRGCDVAMKSVSICVICGQRWLLRDRVSGEARDASLWFKFPTHGQGQSQPKTPPVTQP